MGDGAMLKVVQQSSDRFIVLKKKRKSFRSKSGPKLSFHQLGYRRSRKLDETPHESCLLIE